MIQHLEMEMNMAIFDTSLGVPQSLLEPTTMARRTVRGVVPKRTMSVTGISLAPQSLEEPTGRAHPSTVDGSRQFDGAGVAGGAEVNRWQ